MEEKTTTKKKVNQKVSKGKPFLTKGKKILKRTLYTSLYIGLFAGGLYLGNTYQPIDKAKDFVKYYHITSEKGTPKDYNNWEVKKEINDNNRVELYLGDKVTNSYKLIKSDGTVGTSLTDTVFVENSKKFGKYIDDCFDDALLSSKKTVDSVKTYFGNLLSN